MTDLHTVGKMSIKMHILDGGFSSQISTHVNENSDGHPLWTARYLFTQPEAVVKTHLDFLRAGSEMIETNTYQASVSGFKNFLNINEDEAKNLIKTAAVLAKKAVGQFQIDRPGCVPTIVGSIGPYGAALHDGSEYTGSYADFTSEEEIQMWHRPRIELLIESGIIMFAIETVPCEKEAMALAGLLKNYPNVKAWISFSCKDDKFLAHGEIFHETARKVFELNPQQLVAVGVNCLHPDNVLALLKPINEGREDNIPLVVYPNSGERYIHGQWAGDIAHIESYLENWIEVGVRYVGGCCRTKAEHIARIKQKIEKILSS